MKKTVLVVDDSDSMRQLVTLALRRGGYDVVESSDGVEALSKLNGRKVHLIISDISMPNMDGVVFVRKVRELPDYKLTPVVMLTAGYQEFSRQEARELGVKAWMMKPFDQDKILDLVSRFAQT